MILVRKITSLDCPPLPHQEPKQHVKVAYTTGVFVPYSFRKVYWLLFLSK